MLNQPILFALYTVINFMINENYAEEIFSCLLDSELWRHELVTIYIKMGKSVNSVGYMSQVLEMAKQGSNDAV